MSAIAKTDPFPITAEILQKYKAQIREAKQQPELELFLKYNKQVLEFQPPTLYPEFLKLLKARKVKFEVQVWGFSL